MLALIVRGSTSSEVCRRQILMIEVDPRTIRVRLFTTAVDPKHRYSNESESAN